jgi:hypothetical protein
MTPASEASLVSLSLFFPFNASTAGIGDDPLLQP